jgi:sialate O-acetylesterase
MAATLAWAASAFLFGASAASSANVTSAEAPLMDALFTSHAVLQRDRPVDIWGHANPGEKVTVMLSDVTREALADAAGHWAVAMPALPAGGPYTLSARSESQQQSVDDVLMGDVFLCSGQSNMELQVRASLNSRAEIMASANNRLRQLTVPRGSSTTQRDSFDKPLTWKIAAPETTGDFSATCYYFARELQKSIDTPIGLVVAAWGGSKLEPWVSEGAMRSVPGNEDVLAVMAEYRVNAPKAIEHWGQVWQKWWLAQPDVEGRRPWLKARDDANQWRRAPAELTPWENWGVPELAKFNGMVWYRTSVKLSAAQAKQSATLSLGQVDDFDITFLNGRAVGSAACCGERTYPLQPGALKAGDNLIVVNVLDTYASGGMHGPAEKRVLTLADGTAIPLGGWEYNIAPVDTSAPRAPWEPTSGIAMLYNAMIAPLANYAMRAVVWYQGESNTSGGQGRRYESLLRTLMADWRRQFAAPLTFLIVQLPNYGAMSGSPVESEWALTREAQRRAVAADGNAGLAVTIDIGNRDDVHPTNKQEVGARLARAARHVMYGEKLPAPGAQPRSAQRSGTNVIVTLADFDAPLVVYGSKEPSAFELCGAAAGSCRFVHAEIIDGGRVQLAGDAADATRVRFCWADSPLCNLYDSAGLPVGPFEIEVKP